MFAVCEVVGRYSTNGAVCEKMSRIYRRVVNRGGVRASAGLVSVDIKHCSSLESLWTIFAKVR